MILNLKTFEKLASNLYIYDWKYLWFVVEFQQKFFNKNFKISLKMKVIFGISFSTIL